MNGHGSWAECHILKHGKKADIRILDPLEWPTSDDLHQLDLEQTLVHELVHIMYSHQPKFRGNDYKTNEAAIDLTASALVAAKRGKMNMISA